MIFKFCSRSWMSKRRDCYNGARLLGLLGEDRYRDPRLGDPIIEPVIGEVLNCIKLLLTKSDDLKSTYGLNESCDADGHLRASTVLISAKRTKKVQDSFERLQVRLLKQRKQTNLIQRSKWAIVDKDKFGTLLTNFNGLVSASKSA